MTLYYIPFSFYDYYIKDTGAPTTGTALLLAETNNFLSPNFVMVSYGLIDTAPIPDSDVITAATFSFTANTYTASRGKSKIYTVWQLQGATYIPLTNGTDVTWSSGANSVVLAAAELAYIQKTGITAFRITVADPGVSKYRKMDINAFETSQATAMRLDVTHGPAVSNVPQRTLVGVGL